MKKIFKYKLYGIIAIVLTACGDLYETHEKYLSEGEETYIGMPDTLIANGGYKRIELKWKLNADSRISKSVITWNGCLEPLEIPVDRSKEFMSTIINIEEGKYIFKLVNISETKKESLPQTVSGEVYGESYQARLPQRGISSMHADPKGVTINWASEEGCIGTNLIYTNNANERKKLFIGEEEVSTFIEDFVPGTEFSVSSMFKPEENAIDEITSLDGIVSFPSFYVVSKTDWDDIYHVDYVDIDRTGWTVEATTEEMTGEASAAKPHNGQAVSLLDDDLTTFWHSEWQNNAQPPLPHIIIMDMKEMKNIISIELARRINNKDTKNVVFSISEDKENWTELGQLDFPDAATPNTMILLLPESVRGRYLRTMVTGSNNGVNASIAEILFTSGKQ